APGSFPGVDRVLATAGAPPPRGASTFELLPDGIRAYQAIIAALRSARRSIRIETFILGGRHDPVAEAIVDTLADKARAVVEVSLLLDGLGSFRANRAALSRLEAAGGRVRRFIPVFHIPYTQARNNLRNHRKLIVVDGAQAILGGMNLAAEYLGPEPDPARWL